MLKMLHWLLHGEDVGARIGWSIWGGMSALGAVASETWPPTPAQWILVASAAMSGWASKRLNGGAPSSALPKE